MKKPGCGRAWLLHLRRLAAHVVLAIIPIGPDVLHASLALFPDIRRVRVCGVEFADDGAGPVSGRSLACQREVRRAIFIGIHAQAALLAAHRLQQRHEQPALLLGQLVAGDSLERLYGRTHAALAFWLVVCSGSVLHVTRSGLQDFVGGGHSHSSFTNAPPGTMRPLRSLISFQAWV